MISYASRQGRQQSRKRDGIVRSGADVIPNPSPDPSNEDACRMAAAQLQRDHEHWLVLWGCYTRSYIAFPLFHAPRGTILTASAPGDMVTKMRREERSAGVRVPVPASVPAQDWGATGQQPAPGWQGGQDTQDWQGAQSPQDWQGAPDRQDWQSAPGPQDWQGTQDRQDWQGRQDWQNTQSRQNPQGYQGSSDPRTAQDQPSSQERSSAQDWRDIQGWQGSPGWPGPHDQDWQG
jgi:hypothetical protein